jgi:hypothetical protein
VFVGQGLHCTPVRLSRGGGSFQFGRASAPIMPHNLTMPMANAARKNPSIVPFWKLYAVR